MTRAMILGCSGPEITEEEIFFFHKAQPWGFILFARNIVDAEQLRHLTEDLRDTVGRRAPIFIDQEGGRVARLLPPLAHEWEDARIFLEHFPDLPSKCEAMRLRYRVIASELIALGIDGNCAPIVDLLQPDTHEVITDRCYGAEYEEVAAIGRAVADGLFAGGVLPVLKHIPGHGRATVDSHEKLPKVDVDVATLEASDFAAFRDLSDLPIAMTAHVRFTSIDEKRCATQSEDVIDVIRNDIGFDGLLMTDDLSMGALRGLMFRRVRAAFNAGCDIALHCNGNLEEMQGVLKSSPILSGASLRRAEDALAVRQAPDDFDVEAALARIEDLKKGAAHAGGSF